MLGGGAHAEQPGKAGDKPLREKELAEDATAGIHEIGVEIRDMREVNVRVIDNALVKIGVDAGELHPAVVENLVVGEDDTEKNGDKENKEHQNGDDQFRGQPVCFHAFSTVKV